MLRATAVPGSQCPVIRGIQIKKPEGIDLALNFQRVALDHIRNSLPGLLGTVSVQLNAVAEHLGTGGDGFKCHAVANAGVNSGRHS